VFPLSASNKNARGRALYESCARDIQKTAGLSLIFRTQATITDLKMKLQ
jgi:hypothetical protein